MKPLLVELAGLPAAGKTTTAALLSELASNNGFGSSVCIESASICPLHPQKREWEFTSWTLFQNIQNILQFKDDKRSDLIVLDRGLVDSVAWLNWFELRGMIPIETGRRLLTCATEPSWFEAVAIVVLLTVDFDTALERRGHTGRIMNRATFEELEGAYHNTLHWARHQRSFPELMVIDTDNLQPWEVVNQVVAGVNTWCQTNATKFLLQELDPVLPHRIA